MHTKVKIALGYGFLKKKMYPKNVYSYGTTRMDLGKKSICLKILTSTAKGMAEDTALTRLPKY